MENVADALRMAAGTLLALLILSLVVYVFRSVSSLENTKDEQEEAAQRTEFNIKFLAFNKSSMYGTDLISVLGLAIANNKTVNAAVMANPDGSYREDVDGGIDIYFKIRSQDITTKTTVTTYRYLSSIDTYKVETTTTIEKTVLQTGTQYHLVQEDNNGDDSIINILDKIAIEGNNTIETTTKTIGTTTTVTENDNSGFNDLKKLIFKCTNVYYNEVGRIYGMEFEEIDTTSTN